jgi:hypothetical protein
MIILGFYFFVNFDIQFLKVDAKILDDSSRTHIETFGVYNQLL